MAYQGYRFFINSLELPYAPSELKVTIGSNNETVQLINGEEINILKNPKLTEIEFEIELPRGRQYAFANKLQSPSKYLTEFENIMKNKTPVNLVIVRMPQNGKPGNTLNGFLNSTWKASLEGYELKESAENAYDIRVALKFKEYKAYGTYKKVVKKTQSADKKISVETAQKDVPKNKKYVVKKGDCLWKIAKAEYGGGSDWKKIYDANKEIIEATAKKYGKKSSSNGHWIYPGCELVIPKSK